jgi:hypothetical protein
VSVHYHGRLSLSVTMSKSSFPSCAAVEGNITIAPRRTALFLELGDYFLLTGAHSRSMLRSSQRINPAGVARIAAT